MIVFITHGDGPRGAERAVRNLLTDAPPLSHTSVISLGKPFDVPNERHVRKKMEAVIAALREVKRGHETGKAVTLCYVNSHMLVPFMAFVLVRIYNFFVQSRTRLILWEHCVPHTHYERRRGIGKHVIRALYSGLLRMADAVIAPSLVIRDDLNRHFPRIHTPVFQLKNPIVLDPVTTKNVPVEWPKDTVIRTLFVGSLTAEKQPHIALDWIAANRELNAHLILCGDGPLREELQQRIRDQNLSATVIGHVKNLRQYYQLADLLLCTSSYETYSNVIAEAVMCGCPVITTDWPGVDALYGEEPLVSIHHDIAPPVFKVKSAQPRSEPDLRLINFDSVDHFKQLEEKGLA